MKRLALILLALLAWESHGIDCTLYARLARDPAKNQETLAVMRKAIQEAHATKNYEPDEHAGKLLPTLESMPAPIMVKLQAIGSMGKALTLTSLHEIEPNTRYTYVVLPIDGKPVVFVSSSLSHRQVGGFREAISAGEITFKTITLPGGGEKLVVDTFNLQSGLYQPPPERVLATFDALVAAGFEAPELSQVKVANGIWDKQAKQNTVVVDFRAILEEADAKK